MDSDILKRKTTHFVLWVPHQVNNPPKLIIGQFQPGVPPTLRGIQEFSMISTNVSDLWKISASSCNLKNGEVYHYWFEVENTLPGRSEPTLCSDPTALTVDWRLTGSPSFPRNSQPASVIKFDNGKLIACDVDGEEINFTAEPLLSVLPTNNHIVIYELPTAWTVNKLDGNKERGVGTFRDIIALIDKAAEGANFSDLDILRPGQSYLTELGVNTLELLPVTDSIAKREWGYAPSHFLAPDFDLGFPENHSWPTPSTDLASLVQTCHQNGIRFFVDMVMAFGEQEPYQNIDFDNFFIANPNDDTNDPDALTSTRGFGRKEVRNGFGHRLFRYSKFINTYDPISGQEKSLSPARQLMLTALTRWMEDYHIDGVRIDSVENVANWDFLEEFKDLAHSLWHKRWIAQNLGSGFDERFLVVGEELSLPLDILQQKRLDGLWNDRFRESVRSIIIGENSDNKKDFEDEIRKTIDCRMLGFVDGTQAINYITSHDVEGNRRERLFNFLTNVGFSESDIEKRIKLAFVCLLTSVGIPMILAGEEFADQHDLFDAEGNISQNGGKQVDPVNYSRVNEPMRKRVFEYVSNLVKLRTLHPALSVNDTKFIHVDFNENKRVIVWLRGKPDNPVIVVANFSSFITANAFAAESKYVVANWPSTPTGKNWKEVTQNRQVSPALVGQEPIFPWEAKVYILA